MRSQQSQRSHWLLYAVLLSVVLLIAMVGYSGFLLYPRLDLPAGIGLGLLILATAAGVAAFFSPCSFPLLITLLARESTVPGNQPASAARVLGFAAALALGAVSFLLLIGFALALGGQALLADITFTSTTGRVIRMAVGAMLILLGLIQLGVIPLTFHGVGAVSHPLLRSQARLRRTKPVLAFGVYGFGYILAGFG